jgi:hypothetical protein
MSVRKVKVAVLFRGPVRPDIASVSTRCNEFMSQFANVQNVEFTTYLATWRKWRDHSATDLIHLDQFDNVIMQAEPTDAQIARATGIATLPNGAEIRPVFNMYYQSKTALDVIHAADDYDYIVHSRTDMRMIMGETMAEWFDNAAYTAPHVHPHPWMCDQFGIAPAAMMYAAWNYGSIAQLGKDIEAADIPERVLQNRIDALGIPVKAPKYALWDLDPRRNQ